MAALLVSAYRSSSLFRTSREKFCEWMGLVASGLGGGLIVAEDAVLVL